jgi:hypothetical protein
MSAACDDGDDEPRTNSRSVKLRSCSTSFAKMASALSRSSSSVVKRGSALRHGDDDDDDNGDGDEDNSGDRKGLSLDTSGAAAAADTAAYAAAADVGAAEACASCDDGAERSSSSYASRRGPSVPELRLATEIG